MRNCKLSLEEVKRFQIDMLIEIDKICRENNITYYLAYGTLLGAIRHRGYIPWDDDIDIMMTRSEIERFKQIYNSCKYRIVDVHNEPNYEYPHPRFIATDTFQKKGLISKLYGIFIDIYPIEAIPEDTKERFIYLKKLKCIKNRRMFFIKWRNRAYKYLPINRFPFIKYYTLKYEKALGSVPYDSSRYVQVFNPFHDPLKKEIFDGCVDVDFEGYKFMAPIGWDEFLTNSYGNYMELPPEEDRHPYHGTDSYYLK